MNDEWLANVEAVVARQMTPDKFGQLGAVHSTGIGAATLELIAEVKRLQAACKQAMAYLDDALSTWDERDAARAALCKALAEPGLSEPRVCHDVGGKYVVETMGEIAKAGQGGKS